MRRREFVVGIAGAAAWPIAARAQQSDKIRRIGIILPASADEPRFQALVDAFIQELAKSGWLIGRNIWIETRWATRNITEIRKHATQLAALAPDVVLAHGTVTVGPLLQATRTVPIVFPVITDPVGAGLVESQARPGGNATGFMTTDYSIGVKWLELLKQIAPTLTRVAVFRDLQGPGPSQFAVIQALGPSLRVEATPFDMRNSSDIESAITGFASGPNGGLIVTAGPGGELHRDVIVSLAARHKLPGVYFDRSFVGSGGLISYGADFVDQYRHAAGYVDRILKGEKPTDMPVQAPTKYELVINRKTAKALGLDVPPSLLARADEVIE
jgi:putative ABC transport system substrate-binding protein